MSAVKLRVSDPGAIDSPRHLFEMSDDVVYLNCANMAPQLRSVTEAGIRAVRSKETPWTISAADWFSGAEELRATAATLLGARSDDVALVPAASYGIAVAAKNLPVSGNQTIVLLEHEFPSNVYAWRALAREVSAKIVTVRRSSTGWTEAVEESIDSSTAIVAVSNSHWTDGSLVDLERVSRRVREVGASLVVDASQSLGAMPLDLSRVQPDFLVSVGYKWLLGPYGLGYLYVAPKWQHRARPLEESWLTRLGSENFARLVDYTDHYRPGARRFDMGEFPQFVLAPMATAALRQILSWRVERIQAALGILTQHIAEQAPEAGYEVLPVAQRCAHMIGLRRAGGLPAGLADHLREARIVVSVRGESIRIGPHLYNTTEEIDRLFAALRRFRGSAGRR